MGHLSNDAVLAFAGGELGPDDREPVERHLGECTDCRTLVAETIKVILAETEPADESEINLSGAVAASRAEPPVLAPGATVSRYVVTRAVGAGSGGIVYEAYDPHLQRKIGIKLLRPVPTEGMSLEEISAGLLLEAQTMARLSHPNVVGVYDVGTFDGQIFIVMEYVEGRTLTEWLAERPRHWREILDVFLAAGRGLAAAHAARLVHRDFKPDNVLVGADGAPRVTDFGLARPVGLEVRDAEVVAGAASRSSGWFAGTPAFMAPEQWSRAADTRSDQFSFCVALHWALYARRPFHVHAGTGAFRPTAPERGDETSQGRDIPAWVHHALLRGLQLKPKERHASMETLLAALSGPLEPRNRSWSKVVLATFAAMGLIALATGLGRRGLVAGAVCGNGRIEDGEACDDGNSDDSDRCLSACRWARCGDGRVWRPVEECDDGNRKNSDGCTARCRRCDERDPERFLIPETGHCYALHRTPVDWPTARGTCARQGQSLVIYHSDDEARAVETAFLEAAWIGLRRESAGPSYLWITGEALRPRFARWWERLGDPSGLPDCVFQSPIPRPPGEPWRPIWTAAPCDERRAFVCEQEDWLIDPLTNHAYRTFFDEEPWERARSKCEQIGGHLATITSQEELDFLKHTITADVWIGLTDAAQEAAFTWVTGEPFLFAAFSVGEPAPGAAARNDCVVLSGDRTWHDRSCAASFALLCEVDR